MKYQLEENLSAEFFQRSLVFQAKARRVHSVVELFQLTWNTVKGLAPGSCLWLWIWDEKKQRACRAHFHAGENSSRHTNHSLTLPNDSDVVRLFQKEWVDIDAAWIPVEALELASSACPKAKGLAYMRATTTDGTKLLFTSCVPSDLDLDFRFQRGFLLQLCQVFVTTVERIRLARELDLLSRIAKLEIGSHSRREFFNKVAIAVAEAFGAQGCSIFLHDRTRDVLVLGGTTGLFDPRTKNPLTSEELRTVEYRRGEGLTGWMFENNAPVRMYDANDPDEWESIGIGAPTLQLSRSAESPNNGEECRPFLGTPIAVDGRIVGVIRLHGKKSNTCFLPSDDHCLNQVSASLAHTIQHWNTSIEQRDELRLNGSVLDVVVGFKLEYEPNAALKMIASETKRLFEAIAASVLVLDPNGETFCVEVDVSEVLELTRELGRQIWLYENVVQNKQSLAIAEMNGQCNEFSRGANEGVRSRAAVPIRSGNDVLGVLIVDSKDVGFFVQSDNRKLQLLELLAAHAAVFLRPERQDFALHANDVLHHLTDHISALVGPIVNLADQSANLPKEELTRRLGEIRHDGQSVQDYWERLKHEGTFDRPNLKHESLNGILEGADWMISALAKKKCLDVRRNYDQVLNSENAYVECDLAYVHIILSHLVTNSVDASEESESLELKTEFLPGNFARFSVIDCGCGMNVDDQKRAFREKFTRKSGSGKGLFRTASLMKIQSGRYGLESELGKGTTVWVEFPCRPWRGE